jgi:putative transposase
LQQARSFSESFFSWYNQEHRHSGIAMLTPEMVHYGRAEAVIAARRLMLEEAYRQHPERFVRRPPEPLRLPAAVWINPPLPPTLNSFAGASTEIISCVFDPQVNGLSVPDS